MKAGFKASSLAGAERAVNPLRAHLVPGLERHEEIQQVPLALSS